MPDSSEPLSPAAWLQTVGQAQVALMGRALDAMEGGQAHGIAAFWRTGLEAWGKLLAAGAPGE